jgi:hypothetical protein
MREYRTSISTQNPCLGGQRFHGYLDDASVPHLTVECTLETPGTIWNASGTLEADRQGWAMSG